MNIIAKLLGLGKTQETAPELPLPKALTSQYKFNEQVFTGVLNQEMQFQVSFKNPYDQQIQFQCSLESETPHVFKLLAKNK